MNASKLNVLPASKRQNKLLFSLVLFTYNQAIIVMENSMFLNFRRAVDEFLYCFADPGILKEMERIYFDLTELPLNDWNGYLRFIENEWKNLPDFVENPAMRTAPRNKDQARMDFPLGVSTTISGTTTGTLAGIRIELGQIKRSIQTLTPHFIRDNDGQKVTLAGLEEMLARKEAEAPILQARLIISDLASLKFDEKIDVHREVIIPHGTTSPDMKTTPYPRAREGETIWSCGIRLITNEFAAESLSNVIRWPEITEAIGVPEGISDEFVQQVLKQVSEELSFRARKGAQAQIRREWPKLVFNNP